MENLIQISYHLDELRNLVSSIENFDPKIPMFKADIIDAYNIFNDAVRILT